MNITYLAMSDIPSKNANSLQIVQMCNALSEIGCKVKLTKPSFYNTSQLSIKKYYGIKNKIQIINIGRKIKNLSKIDNIIIPFKLSIYALLNKKEIFITRNLVVSLFLILLRIKHILELHDDIQTSGKKISIIFKKLSLLNSSKISKLVFITRNLKKFISKKYNYRKKNFQILPDASSLKISLSKTVKKKKLKIGYFGSIYRSRGVDFIYKLSKLDSKNNYFIYGGNKHEIDKIKKKYKLKNLYFNQQIPYCYISNYLSKMDILLMPYSSKVTSTGDIGDISKFMSPMKMFDYLAAGKLIISSDLPVLREVLRHKYNSILIKNYEKVTEWKRYIDNFNFSLYKIKIIKKNAQKTACKHTWVKRAKNMISLT